MPLEYQQLPDGDLEPEAKVNANSLMLGQAYAFGLVSVSGLVLRIGGGPYNGSDRSGANLTASNGTNYIVAAASNGALSISTSTTNWSNTTNYRRVGIAVFASGVMTSYLDQRHDAGGVFNFSASGSASTTQTGEMMSGYIGTVANKDYRVVVNAAHGGTITETTTISESGTATFTFKINSTALGGTANSVSTSEQTRAHSSANVFSAGDDIVITASSNAACLGASFCIKYTRVYL